MKTKEEIEIHIIKAIEDYSNLTVIKTDKIDKYLDSLDLIDVVFDIEKDLNIDLNDTEFYHILPIEEFIEYVYQKITKIKK